MATRKPKFGPFYTVIRKIYDAKVGAQRSAPNDAAWLSKYAEDIRGLNLAQIYALFSGSDKAILAELVKELGSGGRPDPTYQQIYGRQPRRK